MDTDAFVVAWTVLGRNAVEAGWKLSGLSVVSFHGDSDNFFYHGAERVATRTLDVVGAFLYWERL